MQKNRVLTLFICAGFIGINGLIACSSKEAAEDAIAKVGEGTITKESFQASL